MPIINLSQVASDYDSATVDVEFYYGPHTDGKTYYWGTYNTYILLNDVIISNENFNILSSIYPTQRAGQFYGWNKRWNGDVTYGNTNRLMIPYSTTQAVSGINKTGGARFWSANNLYKTDLGRTRIKDRIKIPIGINPNARQNSKAITVKNIGSDWSWNDKWCSANSITLYTATIPAPAIPSVGVYYESYVDGAPTKLKIAASLPENVRGFYYLRIEEMSSSGSIISNVKQVKGATYIDHVINIGEGDYDKTRYWRARVFAADQDKASGIANSFIEYPYTKMYWYENATTRRRIKKAYWFDENGIRRQIKQIYYRDGGTWRK